MNVKKIRTKITINSSSIKISLGIITSVGLWILLAFSPCKIDASGYQAIFYDTSGTNFSKVEIGFYWLMKLARLMDFNYWAFRALILGMSILMLNIAIQKFKGNILEFWILVSIFPLLYLAIQIRFFFALSIGILGVSFLLNEKKTKRAEITFVILVMLGTLFHSAILLFLIFLIPYMVKGKKFHIIISLLIAIEIMSLLFFDRVVLFVASFIRIVRSLVTYYTFRINMLDWLQFTLTYIVLAFLTYFIMKSDKDTETLTLRKNICITNVFLVELVLLNSTFSRYFQASSLILLIFIVKKGSVSRQKFILKILFIVTWCFLSWYILNGRIWDAWGSSFMEIKGWNELINMH